VTPKQSSQPNANLFPKKVPQKMATERFGNFGRHSNRSQLNQTHNERKSANDYHNVESKIRDEVKYHKELSKQYKKMKQSIQEYTDNVNEKFSNASSSQRREKDKFVLVEKDDQKAVSRLYQFGPSSYRPSGLFDSTSSPQKSLYLKASSSQYSNKSPSYGASSARYNKESQENLSQSKNSGGRNGGGMLDIANSFLNSPFMQHLSNLDAKSSRISPDSSINKKIDRSDYIDLIKNNKNLKTSFEERRSPKKSNYTSYKMEDARAGDITQNYSKYSNWVGNYKQEKGNSSSILKESDNKRYNEYVGKEINLK